MSSPKFKVGDVVRTTVSERWPKVVEIRDINSHSYNVLVLETSEQHKPEIGKIWQFHSPTIDRLWCIDTGYKAARQFDEDLETLLKE